MYAHFRDQAAKAVRYMSASSQFLRYEIEKFRDTVYRDTKELFINNLGLTVQDWELGVRAYLFGNLGSWQLGVMATWGQGLSFWQLGVWQLGVRAYLFCCTAQINK